MPNHLHAIVILKKPNINDSNNENVDDSNNDNVGDTKISDILQRETHGRASLQQGDGNEDKQVDDQKKPYLYRLPKSISSFIGGFKSGVNSRIDDFIDEHKLNIPKYNRYNHFFQPNYHDHIIRNKKSHYKIFNYIINNPKKWDEDKFNPKNK